VLDAALCQGFVEHLKLDERDIRELARLAHGREHQQSDQAGRLQRQGAEHRARLERAKQLALQARDDDLAGEFLEEARQAKRALVDMQTQLVESQQKADISPHAWLRAEQAATIAERVRATFADWSRPAQARVLLLALQDAMVGWVDRRVVGLWMRWHGGGVSRQEMVTRYGRHLRWTPQEEEALRCYYDKLTWQALDHMFPARTRSSIERYAHRIGLSRSASAGLLEVPPIVVPGPEVVNSMASYGFPLPPGTVSTKDMGSFESPPSARSSSCCHVR